MVGYKLRVWLNQSLIDCRLIIRLTSGYEDIAEVGRLHLRDQHTRTRKREFNLVAVFLGKERAYLGHRTF